MKTDVSDSNRRTLHAQCLILGLLVLVSSNHVLHAQEMRYPCRVYNIWDQVPIQSLEFSRDGKQLAVAAQSVGPPELRVIDLLLPQPELGKPTILELGNRYMGECARFSPDGRFVASGAFGPGIDIWDIAKAKLVHSFTTTFLSVNAVAFSPNGELLVASGMKDSKTNRDNDELILFDFKKRQQLAAIPLAYDPTHFIFSRDGRLIYGADTLDSILVVDVEKRQVAKTWKALDDDASDVGVLGLSLSRDGKRLASGGRDKKVKIWDAETGKLVKSFDGHEEQVLSVALSPDGKYVASGGFDGRLWVRDVESGRTVEYLSYGDNRPYSVTFSPDSQWLASGAADGRIFLDRVADFQFLNPKPNAVPQPSKD